ncbi:MAG: hypothetical protein RLO81_06550, partial [Fulvivirga sp.]|uniref:hypothetical protein n=1 Tax=Fulvivirga sp. TaxID=1931237 RepID=UPI0032EB56AE
MRKLIFFCLIILSYNLLGIELHIIGPDVTCPNSDILEYDVYATGVAGEKLSGGIGWEVYVNGVRQAHMSSGPYSCGNDKDFTITFPPNGSGLYGWQDVGQVELKVFFKGGITCFNLTKSKFITSRVPDPGIPTTSDGGLTFCPGESKIVTLSPPMIDLP